MRHKTKLAASFLVLSLVLASCGTPTTPDVSAVLPENPHGQAVTTTAPVVVYNLSPEQTPGVTLAYDGPTGTQTLLHTNGAPYFEQQPRTITAQNVTKIRDEWIQKGTWQKTLTSPSRQECRPPRSFTASVTGSYSIKVGASGDISVVKLSGEVTGGMTLTAGITYTWTACAYFQKTEIERYQRWELWAYYSDGSSKWTGGVSNTRLPSQYGDVQDKRISSWQIR